MVERAFNPNRVPSSQKATELISEVQNWIQNFENFEKPRDRKRKPKDQATFERTVNVILSDVICSYHENPDCWLYLSLSHRAQKKRSRYEPFSFGKTLPDILRKMANDDLDFLRMNLGKKELMNVQGAIQRIHRQTTISAGTRLIKRIKENNITIRDFEYSEDEEVIILKAKKRGHKDRGEWIDYRDDEQIVVWRNGLRAINAWLSKAPLSYEGQAKVEITDRRLLRIFNNGEFNEGGRFYGGFWLQLPKLDRLENIRIDGEKIAELDYGQMALRLLYGKLKRDLPPGDLYNVAPYQQYREGIKLIVNSALFKEKKGKMPHGGRKFFPQKLSYVDILAAVEQYHNAVSRSFFTGIGMNLQFLESEVLFALLTEAMKTNVPLLPIHDAVLVQNSKAELMKNIMLETFKRHSGVEAKVSIDQ